MRVEVIRAWPDRHESIVVTLPGGANALDAVRASGFDDGGHAGLAVYGERVTETSPLQDGDRLELLRPLQVDPKESRRRRASARRAAR